MVINNIDIMKIGIILFCVGFLFFGINSSINAATISASEILGQTSWTANTTDSPSGSVNGSGFNNLSSLVLDTFYHRLFVSDRGNNRVLIFQLDNNNSIETATAQYVLGACDLTTAGTGFMTASTFGGDVVNIEYDSVNKRLFVSDFVNARVLAFNVDPTHLSAVGNCDDAIFVLGQADFGSSLAATTQSGFFGPDNVAYDSVNERLFVADENNRRVMAFNVPADVDPSTLTGEDAIFVLGQADFTHRVSATTQNGLKLATGVAYDSINERLFVADSTNNRVMAFNVPADVDPSTLTGEDAIFVLGQADFTHGLATTTQSGFDFPDDIVYDTVGNRLFVSDTGNNRIMIFNVPSNATSSFNGADAQGNIGQSTWTSTASGIDQNIFSTPESPHAYDSVNNKIYLYDDGKRALEINMIRIQNKTGSLPDGPSGSAYSQTIAIDQNQGDSYAFSLYSGTLPTGLSLNYATGEISGTPSVEGTYNFTIEVDDVFTGSEIFFDRASYSLNVVAEVTPPTNVAIDHITVESPTILTIVAKTPIDTGSGLSATPYWFTETSGNPGATSSTDWQASNVFTDTGLTSGTQYTYKVKVRDANGNVSAYSAEVSKTPYAIAGGGGNYTPTTTTVITESTDTTQQPSTTIDDTTLNPQTLTNQQKLELIEQVKQKIIIVIGQLIQIISLQVAQMIK